MSKPGLTERVVQGVLHTWLVQRGYPEGCVTTNFTPARWFECDVYALTKAGFAWEFEIKVSRSDFFKDVEKGTRARYGRVPPAASKHELLESRSPRCPNRFSYVVPEGLVTESEVPSWAGLLLVCQTAWGHTVRQSIAAPQLHKEPPDKSIAVRMKNGFYYRFWSLLKAKAEPSAGSPPDPMQLLLAAVDERRMHLQSIEDEERLEELDMVLDLAKKAFDNYGNSDD